MLLENLESGSERNSYCVSASISVHEGGQKPGSYNIISANVVGLSKGAHHKRVVESHNGNDIDALFSEVGKVLDEAGQVVHGAGWGESTYTGGIQLAGVIRMRLARKCKYSPGTEKRTTFLSAHSLEAL